MLQVLAEHQHGIKHWSTFVVVIIFGPIHSLNHHNKAGTEIGQLQAIE
jgi:hypothetical protein